MARGGARVGSGRPPGARNKRTEEQVAAITASGLSPLEYLTSVYQDVNADEAKRIDAAKAAAPYVHPRLSQVDAKIGGDPDNPLVTRIELVDGDGTD